MKVCLVTAFPPSTERLNEYGFHLAKELKRHNLVSLTILADDFEKRAEELPDFDVERCWKFNSVTTPLALLRAVRKHKPGDKVEVKWQRGSQQQSATVDLGSRPASAGG